MPTQAPDIPWPQFGLLGMMIGGTLSILWYLLAKYIPRMQSLYLKAISESQGLYINSLEVGRKRFETILDQLSAKVDNVTVKLEKLDGDIQGLRQAIENKQKFSSGEQ